MEKDKKEADIWLVLYSCAYKETREREKEDIHRNMKTDRDRGPTQKHEDRDRNREAQRT